MPSRTSSSTLRSVMMHHLLILSCSARKLHLPKGETVAAGSLYQGIAYQVFKAWQRRHAGHLPSVSIFIISAKYGLINWNTEIETYDQRMDVTAARRHLPEITRFFDSWADPTPDAVYVELGKTYLPALPDMASIWPDAKITYGFGRIGERMHRLKNWLEEIAAQNCGVL